MRSGRRTRAKGHPRPFSTCRTVPRLTPRGRGTLASHGGFPTAKGLPQAVGRVVGRGVGPDENPPLYPTKAESHEAMLPTSPQLLPSSPPQRSPTATPLPTAPSQPPSPSAPSSRPPDGSPLPSSYPDVHRSSSGQQVLDAPKHTDANLAGCAYRVPSTTSAALSALALTRAQSAGSVTLNRPALERAGHLAATRPADPRLADPMLAGSMLEARDLRVRPTPMSAVATPVPCSVHADDPAPPNRPVLERPQTSDASGLADPTLAAPARVPTSSKRRLPAPPLTALATSAPPPKRLKPLVQSRLSLPKSGTIQPDALHAAQLAGAGLGSPHSSTSHPPL